MAPGAVYDLEDGLDIVRVLDAVQNDEQSVTIGLFDSLPPCRPQGLAGPQPRPGERRRALSFRAPDGQRFRQGNPDQGGNQRSQSWRLPAHVHEPGHAPGFQRLSHCMGCRRSRASVQRNQQRASLHRGLGIGIGIGDWRRSASVLRPSQQLGSPGARRHAGQ